MGWIDILGFAAAVCTSGSLIPQAYKVYKTKKTDDLSILMFSFFSLGVVLWFIYGVIIDSWPVIFSNVITIVLAIYILIMKIKHG